MAENFLITGYWGEPHVTAENDRGIHVGIFGAGRFVLAVGEQFKAEYIGNNTVRLYDGKLLDNGAAAGIPAGEHIDILIPNASQGKYRTDLIVFQYEKDASTLVESGKFVLLKGTEAQSSPVEPTIVQNDLLSGNAAFDQMPLWKVSVQGSTISAPQKVFSLYNPRDKRHPVGSLYFSKNSTSPAELFGGTWTRIKDVFPLAAGDKYYAGSTGGEAEHTLTIDEMPKHYHMTFTGGVGDVSDYLGGSDAGYGLVEGFNLTPNVTNSEGYYTSNTGMGFSHNNMPPYQAFYVWYRVA